MNERKIIFTDFFDTLVPREIKCNNENSNKEYKIIQKFLNEYLNEKNIMYIITSTSHSCLEEIFRVFNRMASNLDKDKLKYLHIYLTGGGDYKFIKDYEFSETGIIINHRGGSKEIIVERLINEIGIENNDKIISAGDSMRDINMLFKVHDIGGTSYYIDKYNLKLAKDMRVESLINTIVLHRFDINILKEMKWHESYVKAFNKLLEQYNSGIINREQLEHMYAIIKISDMYSLIINKENNSSQFVNDIEKKLVLVRDRKDILEKFRI